MKYLELARQGQLELFKAGVANYDFDAWVLIEKICKISRTEYFLKMHDTVDEADVDSFFAAIERRKAHYPLQYIVGEWEFMGLPFIVNEGVLIPRSDTEIIAEKAVNILTTVFEKHEGKIKVLDLCCGTGCVGISIAKMCPNTIVTCSDISKDAIDICNKNVALNNATNVKVVESDLFENIDEKFNMVVCNPPYIPTKVIDTLMPEVRDHEPRLALDGDSDGLKFYRQIIEELKQHLEYDGYIVFEIGTEQAEDVKEMLREKAYSDIEVLKDLPGLDRAVVAVRRRKYV